MSDILERILARKHEEVATRCARVAVLQSEHWAIWATDPTSFSPTGCARSGGSDPDPHDASARAAMKEAFRSTGAAAAAAKRPLAFRTPETSVTTVMNRR